MIMKQTMFIAIGLLIFLVGSHYVSTPDFVFFVDPLSGNILWNKMGGVGMMFIGGYLCGIAASAKTNKRRINHDS